MPDLAERFCATVCLVARYRYQNNKNLWPRILDVLCREASHVSTTQANSSMALPASLLLAAQRH